MRRATTYQVGLPDTSLREASCVEVDCAGRANGWTTETVEGTPLGDAQAGYIRTRSGRRFVEGHWELDLGDGGRVFAPGPARPGEATVFVFEAGQDCFVTHHVRSGPTLYLVRDDVGAHRRVVRRHVRPDDWVEDCAEATDRFNEARKKG